MKVGPKTALKEGGSAPIEAPVMKPAPVSSDKLPGMPKYDKNVGVYFDEPFEPPPDFLGPTHRLYIPSDLDAGQPEFRNKVVRFLSSPQFSRETLALQSFHYLDSLANFLEGLEQDHAKSSARLFGAPFEKTLAKTMAKLEDGVKQKKEAYGKKGEFADRAAPYLQKQALPNDWTATMRQAFYSGVERFLKERGGSADASGAWFTASRELEGAFDEGMRQIPLSDLEQRQVLLTFLERCVEANKDRRSIGERMHAFRAGKAPTQIMSILGSFATRARFVRTLLDDLGQR